MSFEEYRRRLAINDFQAARKQAAMQEILARFTGRSTQLLSYEEVAEKLKLRIRVERGVQQVPLDAIVGSVGRYADFTRTFLPRGSVSEERWTRLKAILEGETVGASPVELYKVGEVYFVIDGNHRVSIARQAGTPSIEARVIEVRTPVPLTPDIQPDDLIVKAEYADFLEQTSLMELRPNVDLSLTVPGQYGKLLAQICRQQCILERSGRGAALFQEAVENWYDHSYIPLAETIRDRGLLPWFPDRTITDLYLWISEHRAELESGLGWSIQSESTAIDLILEKSAHAETGSWRRARTVTRYTENLFVDLLVPLSGKTASWESLEQAIRIAQNEGATIHGLHVVPGNEDITHPAALAIKAQFEQRCADANVMGNLVIEAGEITAKICERAIMTDLVVLRVEHPPMGGLSSLTSPLRNIILNSSRPLLVVPEQARTFKRALLAFDGSPRAREALFVATYFGERWGTELLVFTAMPGTRDASPLQDEVRRYLELHELQAEYVLTDKDAKEALKQAAAEHGVDLVLMGGYGKSTLQQIMIGSSVDYMLRESKLPLFICR